MDKTTVYTDRTKQYLVSLQTQYREEEFPYVMTNFAGIQWFMPANPFRVMVVMNSPSSFGGDWYFRTPQGMIINYKRVSNAEAIVLTSQLHFLLPTYQWGLTGILGQVVNGLGVVKT